jgi:hypothetical protein
MLKKRPHDSATVNTIITSKKARKDISMLPTACKWQMKSRTTTNMKVKKKTSFSPTKTQTSFKQ